MFDRPGRAPGGPRYDRPRVDPVSLPRFDVVASRRTRAFHHYSIGGELTVEEEDVLDEHIERVTCRWCSASGDAIEQVPLGPAEIRRPAP
jgi:hypothetical protein